MAKTPGESKIPVLHSNQLRSRFSNISNKVRSHLDGSYRTSSPSLLFGLFSNSSSESKVHQPTRPSSLFKSTKSTSVTEKDIGSYVDLTQHSKTGILRYFGKTVLGPGDWCGVEVESGHGVCDGSICGVRYFSCHDQCALFVLAHLVRVSECQNVVNDKIESEPIYDDGCQVSLENWDLDIVKTDSPFECTDSLGILTPDQMVEFRGDEAHYEIPGVFFKVSPHQHFTECISDGDITMNDLETISMPKDDDLVSPALSSDPSNHTVSEHDSASVYPKRSTVSFGHVFYDNFTIDRTPSLEDLPMDDLSSKTTTEVPMSNIPPLNTVVTSITSVGSLDTGYQGDGETSRPTSRGATVKLIGPTEPMTDSDFFTESEAEDHCHRKARVIDGTLYSGDNIKPETQSDNQNNLGPTIEEMDSSGVYSDFDRIFEEPPVRKDSSEATSNNSTSPSSVNSQQIHPTVIDKPSNSTIPECTEDASSPASKRYKRPMPVKPKNLDLRQDQENRAPRTRKPAGRWDAVMNKIEKSKTDQKSRVNRLKDVKSKINSINPLATTCTNRLKESPTNSEPLPVRSHRENTPLKAKSRRTRARGGSESNLPMSDQKANSSRPRCIPKSSQNSSRDSSFSDLSGETKITLKQATSHPSLVNKNFNSRTPTVNVVIPSVRKPLTAPSKGTVQNRRFNSDHSLIAKTDGKTQIAAAKPTTTTTTTTPTAAKVKAIKKDEVDRKTMRRVENQLQYVTKGFDAVSVLFQYLVDDMDALSTTRLKQQLDNNHNDLISTKCSLDESQAKCTQYREEIDRLQTTIKEYQIDLELKDKLINEINSLKETEIRELEKKFEEQSYNLRTQFNKELHGHKQETEEEKMKLILSHDQQIIELQETNKFEVSQMQKSAMEKQIELTQRVLILENERDLLKSERDQLKEENQQLIEDKKLHNTNLGYQKLCNEAESLRTVLELKSSEMQDLRKQNEKLQREVEDLPTIVQKLEAAQSRVEDLNVQLQRKSEIEMQLSQEKDKMAREIDLEKQKKKRLSCHNEELQWKLKKSTEVANHLAVSTKRLSQTPQDLAAMKEAQNNYQKLCRENSNSENSGDEDTVINQLDVDLEAPARILGVMKKNDSLSYVFEVEEEPSEIATRLVRRASSLRSVGKSRTRTHDSIGEKRSRASSQSSSSKSVELDSALTRNLDELFTSNTGDRYLSDCFTCSSDSSNSSPEHMVYDQSRTESYIVTQQTSKKTKSDGLTI